MLRPDANILYSDFHPNRSPCTQAQPLLGREGVARQTNGLYLGKERIASNTRPKLSAL